MSRSLVLVLAACLAACGQVTTPDGSCLTDFDCEPDQLCGLQGVCLLCSNCERGRVGTCTVPVFPGEREPDSAWLEPGGDGEVLVYAYSCDQGATEYRYSRGPDDECFDPEPTVSDECGLE